MFGLPMEAFDEQWQNDTKVLSAVAENKRVLSQVLFYDWPTFPSQPQGHIFGIFCCIISGISTQVFSLNSMSS